MKKITDDEFAKEVLASDVPVLLDVYADWCAPCKALAPVLEKISLAYGSKAKVVKMDGETEVKTVTAYNVSALPTIMFFKEGQMVKKFHGFQSEKALKEAIDTLL
jgi:thioredoxin 1